MTPRPPATRVISRFSVKLIVFQKTKNTKMNVVRVKKVNCIFEEPSETKNMQITPDYSSATAIMLIIFWFEHDFCLISDCRNSFNSKLLNI